MSISFLIAKLITGNTFSFLFGYFDLLIWYLLFFVVMGYFIICLYLLSNFSILSFILIVVLVGLFPNFLHEIAAHNWYHRENKYFSLYLELGQKNP